MMENQAITYTAITQHNAASERNPLSIKFTEF